MFRSSKLFDPFPAITALVYVRVLVLLIALGAVAFLFTGCSAAPIPVTSGNAGKAANAVQAPRSQDLGAGYRLVTNEQGVHIVAPETIIRPADKTYDLGAGYRLVVTADGGQIIPPSRPSTYYSRTELGAGYVLEITGEYGRIIPPSNAFQPQAQDATVHKQYIGGGFWLITTADGGQIMQEGSR